MSNSSLDACEQVTGFSFYISYYQSAQFMTDAQRLAFYDAIFEYAFEGKEPDFSTDVTLNAVWPSIKPNVDNSIKNHMNGKRGGRPRKRDLSSECISEISAEVSAVVLSNTKIMDASDED